MTSAVKFIHASAVERPPDSETSAEARVRLAGKFPRNATRRMTHLGLLIGAACDGIPFGLDDAIVYATTYAETRALEDFLSSFPAASPQGFQTSIHPSAVQQVMIGRQQPVRRFWPITGRARLVEHALITALLEPAPRVVVLGGEERGTWLLDQNAASDRAFAFALVLGESPGGSIGTIALHRSETHGAFRTKAAAAFATSPPLLPAFADAVADRRPLRWQSAHGEIVLEWS